MKFNEWIDVFIQEKGVDTEEILEAEGESGTNFIPVGVIIEHMKMASPREKDQIQGMIVQIDFLNGDVLHFFRHLAAAIAK